MRFQPDDRLAALAHAGHEEAFEAIVTRHQASMRRTCRRVLGDGDEDDALQRALMSAHQAVRREVPRDLRPWLHRIAFNAALAVLASGVGTSRRSTSWSPGARHRTPSSNAGTRCGGW